MDGEQDLALPAVTFSLVDTNEKYALFLLLLLAPPIGGRHSPEYARGLIILAAQFVFVFVCVCSMCNLCNNWYYLGIFFNS